MSALAEFQTEMIAALLDPHHSLRARLGVGLAVYQNTSMRGLIDALRANHPTVDRLVGAEWFDAVARLYVVEHLPDEPSLALYGASFSTFIGNYSAEHDLSYLPFVAQLDRLWLEAHFSPDAPALQALSLQTLLPEQLQTLRMKLHPAARIAWLPHSSFTIWQGNRPSSTVPDELQVNGADEGVLISRPAGDVRVAGLTAAEFLFLQQINAGVLLGEAAVRVLELHADADLAAMLSSFIAAGAFAAELELNPDQTLMGE
jgi:hypothetical protein